MPHSLPTTTREWHYSKLGSFQNLAVRDTPLAPPKAGHVLVGIKAASLNYRDVFLVPKAVAPQGTTSGFLPNVVPLSDGAGEVIAVGEDVQGWKVGDRVCANFCLDHLHGDPTPEINKTSMGGLLDGVLTQYRSFPAYSLVRIPDSLSYEEAATLPCAAVTAYNALHGATPIKAGDTVLVQGTGGVAIFALQIAVASGATVIATSSSDEKLKLAEKLGAKHLINYRTTPDWDIEVLKITNGYGVDHIIESAATLDKSIKSVRMGGSIYVIGFVAQDRSTTDFVSLASTILAKSVNIRGIRIGSVAQFNELMRLIQAHDIHPLVDKVFPFDKAIEAYEYLESQKHAGKVVIRISEA